MPNEVAVDNGLTLNAAQQSVEGANNVNGQVVPQTFPVTARVVDTYGKVEFDGGYLQIKYGRAKRRRILARALAAAWRWSAKCRK